MGMSIDLAMNNLSGILTEATEDDNSVCYVTEDDAETLQVAIATMRKYQQVREIYDNWNVDFGVETHRAMSKIGEVLNENND